MSVTYGFYNSSNGDRKYSARQISSIFDGIINDGIYQNYGNHFEVNDARVVSGTNGMYVYVNTGRAWLNHTWTLNDSILKVNIDAADLTNPRIDTVVIEVNESTRINSIKVVKGTAASSPVAPTLTNTSTIHQHPLANVRVIAGATEITLARITNRIGQSYPTGTPWVTGLFETMSIDSIIAQWHEQFEEQSDSWDHEASDRLDAFMEQYEADADAALLELLSEALGNNRMLRVFGISSYNIYDVGHFPTTAGATKTYSQSSPIRYDSAHDFSADFFPKTNIQLGDYLIGQNGYIAKLTYKTGFGDDTKIYSFSVESTGISIAPRSSATPKVLYYIAGVASAELPDDGEHKWLGSQAIQGVSPSGSIITGDILIGNSGKVARVVAPMEWDSQVQDYLTEVVGVGNICSFGAAANTVYTSLELLSSSQLLVKLHNVSSIDGLYIKVQKLTGTTKGMHRWTDDPIGFAGAKAIANSRYAGIPVPSWMPNAGVLQTRFAVTSSVLTNGLTINPSIWLLDAMKPILLQQNSDHSEPDQTDPLAGFADGTYVASLGEYLYGTKADRLASGKKYSLDVRYRFVLCDANGNTIGTTQDALSIPYKTFWIAGGGTRRKVITTTETTHLSGSFRIVAT